MEEQQVGGRTALLVAAFDSQLKWATSVRGALADRGFACRTIVPADVRNSLSPEQVAAYAGTDVEYLSWEELLAASLRSDAVVLVVQGSFVARFCHQLHDLAEAAGIPGPVTVSGWVGVVLREITAGFLDRSACDVVAVNSRSDLRTFTAIAAGLHLPTDNLVLSGLPLLAGGYTAPAQGPIRTVLHADQPTMPSGRKDRLYVYQRLVEYARAHPERTVLLKPRHRPGEGTIHAVKHSPEELLAGVEHPPNFRIDYTPIVEQLPTLDLMLTVSSTAALEAVGAGVRTAFVADLGVREPLGNHIFLASGLLRTFDQIGKDDIGVPDPVWVEDYFTDTGASPPQQLAARVVEILQGAGPRPSRRMRDTDFFRSQHELFTHRENESTVKVPVWRDKPKAKALTWAARGRLIARAVLPSGTGSRIRNAQRELSFKVGSKMPGRSR